MFPRHDLYVSLKHYSEMSRNEHEIPFCNSIKQHLLHILFKLKLFPLLNTPLVVPALLLAPDLVVFGDPGIGDGGKDPVGEDTYFFFPLKRRINLFALSIVGIVQYIFP